MRFDSLHIFRFAPEAGVQLGVRWRGRMYRFAYSVLSHNFEHRQLLFIDVKHPNNKKTDSPSVSRKSLNYVN